MGAPQVQAIGYLCLVMGDIEVSLESDLVKHPGINTVIMYLYGVLHALLVATDLLSLRMLEADGLEYVGRGGMLSMFGVK